MPAGHRLTGFEISPHFGEQTRGYRFEPEVNIHINAPAPADFHPSHPTRLMFYALPNGNTIAWTIGRRPAEGIDWHYHIQHIGAQIRRLREVTTDENIVVAYLEADGRSWPAWKRRHSDFREIIPRIVESVRARIPGAPLTIDLSGHSGGGSFIFGYLDSFESIPADVRRIEFLDSNYGYNDEDGHGEKLANWLKAGADRCLCVICYDDREVELEGKRIVGPTGGTWRATERMHTRLARHFTLSPAAMEGVLRYRGLAGRIDFLMHPNPHKKILHTALVGDMNGFIHAATSGTRHEGRAATFNGPIAYTKWIQAE